MLEKLRLLMKLILSKNLKKLWLLKKLNLLKIQFQQERVAPAANVGAPPRDILGPVDRNIPWQQVLPKMSVTLPSLVISH